MGKLLETKISTISRREKILNFSVMTPPNSDPFIVVVYGETFTNETGELIKTNNQTKVITIPKTQIQELLEKSSLPKYDIMYSGIKELLYTARDSQTVREIETPIIDPNPILISKIEK